MTPMIIPIIFMGTITLVALITIAYNLRILKQDQFHAAAGDSRFMRVMDIIFNRFLSWKRWKKIIPALLLPVFLLMGVAFLYIRYALPKIPPTPDIAIDHHDSALLRRGEYLAEHVAICIDCHSPRDVSYFSWPVIGSLKGAGGPFLSQKLGYTFPGESFTPNITPATLGSWTDGELYRLLTTGIDKNGHTINHVMPFLGYAHMDPTDLKAVIVYIRTLKPISNKPAGTTTINFFHSLYNRTLSRKVTPIYLSSLKTAIDSGYYLVTIGGCNDCHTPKKWLEINDTSRMLGGGIEYPLPTGGFVHSANLTPDKSGLGTWTEATFIDKFRGYRDSGAIYKPARNTFNSLMPWSSYRFMTGRDLHAIYAYLNSIKPVYNPVTIFTAKSLKNQVKRLN